METDTDVEIALPIIAPCEVCGEPTAQHTGCGRWVCEDCIPF